MIKAADRIIGLGPEGGEAAARSRIKSGTADGKPEDVAKVKASYTGQYLKPVLARRAKLANKKQAAE